MAVRQGPRQIQWRNDHPATLIYATVLDGGDPANEVPYRDEVMQLKAPFTGQATSLIKMINRFYRVQWSDANHAFARTIGGILVIPRCMPLTQMIILSPTVMYDINYQNAYQDPGNLVTQRNEYAKSVVSLKDNKAFFLGDGFTDKGQFPFLNQRDLKDNSTTTLYRSEYTDRIEELEDLTNNSNSLCVLNPKTNIQIAISAT